MTEGLCGCGCGEPAPIARKTSTKKGWVKGQPKRFINGHNGRVQAKPLETYFTTQGCGFETPCWVWHGAKTPLGYGYVRRDGRLQPAHRAVYVERKGSIPAGLNLDHLCKNPSCVNPDHLEPVTQAVNVRRGKNTKLTEENVLEIRRLWDLGYAQPQIAERFDVAWQTIASVTSGRSWRSAAS